VFQDVRIVAVVADAQAIIAVERRTKNSLFAII